MLFSCYRVAAALLCLSLLLAALGFQAVRPAALAAENVRGGTTALPVAGRRATVLIFVAHDCPVCNAYSPEITRITDRYRANGIACFAVYAEPDLSPAQAREHAKAFRLSCGLLRDPQYALAHRLGAHITPEAVVLTPANAVAYWGRIDDRFVAYGIARARVKNHDLRNALDALLAKRPIPKSTGGAVGCAIP